MVRVHLDIPIIGDVKIGRRWGGADEVDNDVVTDPEKFEQWLIEHGYDGEMEPAHAI